MTSFIGRKQELQKLNDLMVHGRASLVVIKGRRRIGKSRLIAEFAKDKRCLSFTGLPPTQSVSDQDQRDAFAQQLAFNLRTNAQSFSDWTHAFNTISLQLNAEPTVIIFDEISWMGSKDHTFLPKLKVWWDVILQNYPRLMLILCGSVSVWIEKNIINSTAFFGRISLFIDLEQFSIAECAEFLRKSGFKASLYDQFKLLAVTGGVPWYLEQISMHYTADDNIKRLCFEKNALLVLEFDKIFHDLFNGHGMIHRKIVRILADGMKDLQEIREILDYPQSGSLSDIMNVLIISGFVTQHYSWGIKSEQVGKRSLYRLSDNYLRFYIKYIEPNLAKINKYSYDAMELNDLPGWEAMMGFQVENLLLNNRTLILKALGLSPTSIVADNPFIQYPTTRQKGCQIDYLIQTHTKNLFVCEFKFKRRELGLEIIESVQEKIKRFAAPRGFGVVSVLFHLGGVTNAVHDKRYFYRIIDIADFLEN